MQGNLAGFFDIPLGGSAAPRKRQAYSSKRLQQVVSDFRKQQAQLRNSNTPDIGDGGEESDSGPNTETSRPAKKRKKSDESKGKKGKAKPYEGAETSRRGGRGSGRGRGRGRGGKRASKKREKISSESENDEDYVAGQELRVTDVPVPSREELGLRPRPKPRPVFKPPEGAGDGAVDLT